ncbi:chitin deacetylase [Dinochytrium kinnereticum]|nr:chitin deacetylase [Dinochytrium kinnereticum]
MIFPSHSTLKATIAALAALTLATSSGAQAADPLADVDKISYPLCKAEKDFPACEDLNGARNKPLFSVKPWMDTFNRLVANQGIVIPNLPLTTPPNGSPWRSGDASFKNLRWGDPTNPATELCACTDGNWAFTFDDGPRTKTRDFLDLLKRNNVKATFFVIGANVIVEDRFKENLKAVDADGHQIALHAWSHPLLSTRSTEALVSEIIYTALAIYRAIGKVPRYFRQPYGDIDDRVRFIVAAFGLRSTLWNFDTFDFTAPENDDLSAIKARLGETLRTGVMKPLDWLPDSAGPGSGVKTYKGFISLHHELTDIEFTMANYTMATVLASTSLNGVPTKFNSVPVHQCDYVQPNTPYMDASDPFYNMIVYWDKQLPLRDADFTSTQFPIDFSRPVATSQRPRPAYLNQNGNESKLPFGLSIYAWVGIGIAAVVLVAGAVVRVVSHVYRKSGGFVPFFRDPASTAAASAVQRPQKHGPIGLHADHPSAGGAGMAKQADPKTPMPPGAASPPTLSQLQQQGGVRFDPPGSSAGSPPNSPRYAQAFQPPHHGFQNPQHPQQQAFHPYPPQQGQQGQGYPSSPQNGWR